MILVTGAMGFLGQHVVMETQRQGRPVDALFGRRGGIDLRDDKTTNRFISSAVHDGGVTHVIHCAYPGANGIGTMLDTPADLVRGLLQIDLNVIRACAQARVQKLVCLGSVCAYPEAVTFPTAEDQLWTGYPEAVNAPYGIAKRMQLELLKVYRKQYGLHGIHLILGNLYGPGDRSGHVIPATIRKILAAKKVGAPQVEVWGDGTATREFLFVEDAARAIVAALDRYDDPTPLNICSGEEISIRSLVETTLALCDTQAAIHWDRSKPNGQPRRWFSREAARQRLDWVPQTAFADGLRQTINWLRQEEDL